MKVDLGTCSTVLVLWKNKVFAKQDSKYKKQKCKVKNWDLQIFTTEGFSWLQVSK